MNRFFQSFPTLYYPYGDDYKLATDILRRVNFSKKTKRANAAAIDYTLKDTDTPDNVAARFYGSPHLHWVVLLFNDILNPYYDWPQTAENLDALIDRKYGQGMRDNPHHVEILGTGIQVDAYDPLYTQDGYVLQIQGGTYDGLALLAYTSPLYQDEILTVITNYQYEFAENQKKKQIKLLRPEFVNQAVAQLQTTLRT